MSEHNPEDYCASPSCLSNVVEGCDYCRECLDIQEEPKPIVPYWMKIRGIDAYVTEIGHILAVYHLLTEDYYADARSNTTHKINTIGSGFQTLDEVKAFIEKEFVEKGDTLYD